jgi:hypothetical protein
LLAALDDGIHMNDEFRKKCKNVAWGGGGAVGKIMKTSVWNQTQDCERKGKQGSDVV